MHATSRPRLPSAVPLLGWSGVLPFAAAPLLALAVPELRDVAEFAFIAYGAVILSFLGGARWGGALGGTGSGGAFAEAVAPSLIGFLALLLADRHLAPLALLAGGFAVWLLLDLRDRRWSRAYRRMRLGITGVVLALHALWLFI